MRQPQRRYAPIQVDSFDRIRWTAWTETGGQLDRNTHLYGRRTEKLINWEDTGAQLAARTVPYRAWAGVRRTTFKDEYDCEKCRVCDLYRNTTATYVPIQKVYLEVTVTYDDREMSERDVRETIEEMTGYMAIPAKDPTKTNPTGNIVSSIMKRINDYVSDDAERMEVEFTLLLSEFWPETFQFSAGELVAETDDNLCPVYDGPCEDEGDSLDDGYLLKAYMYFKRYFAGKAGEEMTVPTKVFGPSWLSPR